jgi:hypothetical protein
MRGLGMLKGRRMRRNLQNVHGRRMCSAAGSTRLVLFAFSEGRGGWRSGSSEQGRCGKMEKVA